MSDYDSSAIFGVQVLPDGGAVVPVTISTGQFVTVSPNGTATVPVSINTAEWANTKPLGVMVVSQDNVNGAPQADLIPTP